MRSLLFNILFYLVIPVYMILSLPLLFLPRRWVHIWVYEGLSRLLTGLLRVVVGLKSEVRGLEHLPAGAALIAVKHQSTWDVIALIPHLREPAMILKSELMKLPLFGWFARKLEMIPVERGKGRSAIKKLVVDARDRARDGREIFIFPEGHRMPPGAEPRYKRGIVALYRELDLPVVPVAVNSGLFWGRHAVKLWPGTAIAEILPVIEPGLDDAVFLQKLQEAIEPASARLMDEALTSTNPPPAPANWKENIHTS